MNKSEIKEQIKKITEAYQHVLSCGPATVVINSPRALMQLEAVARLEALYWVLGEKRPRFKCDDSSLLDQ